MALSATRRMWADWDAVGRRLSRDDICCTVCHTLSQEKQERHCASAKKLSNGSAERVSSESRAEGVNILILLEDQHSVPSGSHTSTAQECPFSAQIAPCRRRYSQTK
ncbi:hypothetical protein SRHO_G00050400 [Serrasalmus rhombeus]